MDSSVSNVSISMELKRVFMECHVPNVKKVQWNQENRLMSYSITTSFYLMIQEL